MNGARREQKWIELYSALDAEAFSLYAVAETHLRDLEHPPVHPEWHWSGKNRIGDCRKGGGVGLLWRRDMQWQSVESDCVDHMWALGDVLGRPTAVCVAYMAVGSKQHDANTQLADCIHRDAKVMAADRQIIIVGDFNGHINELDGFTDQNGQLMLQMSDKMELVVANLEPRCCGKVTWCARGSATCIDYTLVSAGLNTLLRHIDIDEKGLHSLGSDHNRLLLEFNCSGSSVSHNRCRKKQGKYLPRQAISDVVDEFEKSALRGQAGNYDDFVAALSSVMQKHMVLEKRRTRVVRKPWWNAEVKTAWQARRDANRRHRSLVKQGDNDACLAAWAEYLDLKHKLQALVQENIAKHNLRLMASLKEEGKSASQKFWRYVQSLDWKEKRPVQLRNAATGEPVLQLKEHLTSHLLRLYGQTEGSKDEAQGEATHTHDPGPLPEELSAEGSGVQWRVSRGEIDRALKRISAHTASGLDGLPAGILKGFGKETKEQLAGLLTEIMEGAPIPREWCLGHVVFIPKKGGLPDLIEDYRPLTVTSVLYRLFAGILKQWMSGWAEAKKFADGDAEWLSSRTETGG